jgi:hypothetical protein
VKGASVEVRDLDLEDDVLAEAGADYAREKPWFDERRATYPIEREEEIGTIRAAERIQAQIEDARKRISRLT